MIKIYWRGPRAYSLCFLRRKGGVVQLERLVGLDSEEAFSGPDRPESGRPGSPPMVAIGLLNAAAKTDATATPLSRKITLSLVKSSARLLDKAGETSEPLEAAEAAELGEAGEAHEETPARKRAFPSACWVLSRTERGGLSFAPHFPRKLVN